MIVIDPFFVLVILLQAMTLIMFVAGAPDRAVIAGEILTTISLILNQTDLGHHGDDDDDPTGFV